MRRDVCVLSFRGRLLAVLCVIDDSSYGGTTASAQEAAEPKYLFS